jgi:hypothetical protein
MDHVVVEALLVDYLGDGGPALVLIDIGNLTSSRCDPVQLRYTQLVSIRLSE